MYIINPYQNKLSIFIIENFLIIKELLNKSFENLRHAKNITTTLDLQYLQIVAFSNHLPIKSNNRSSVFLHRNFTKNIIPNLSTFRITKNIARFFTSFITQSITQRRPKVPIISRDRHSPSLPE